MKKKILTPNIKIIMIACALWGFIAHFQGISQVDFCHDSLREFYTEGIVGYYGGSVIQWKYALGRFMWPLYQMIFRINGSLTSPWLAGIFSFIWLSIAATMLIRLFDIENPLFVVITIGLLVTNITVTLLIASYIGDLDANMFGFMCALLAAYLWYEGRGRMWFAVPCLVVSLGLYQSNISVFVTTVLLISIRDFLENKDWKKIMAMGIKAIFISILSLIVWMLLALLSCKCMGISLTTQQNGAMNALKGSKNYIRFIYLIYRGIIKDCFESIDIVSSFTNFLGLLTLIFLFFSICRKKDLFFMNKLLAGGLALLFPFAMNIAGVLNKGEYHDLMIISYYFIYIFVIVVFQLWEKGQLVEKSVHCRKWLIFLACLLLFQNIKTSNGIYEKKRMESRATLTYMTRLTNFIESIDGYEMGQTRIMIIGKPNIKIIEGFGYLSSFTGANYTSPISSEDVYQPYFDYIMQYPVKMVTDSEYDIMIEKYDFSDLTIYPDKGCYKWINGILAVKAQ